MSSINCGADECSFIVPNIIDRSVYLEMVVFELEDRFLNTFGYYFRLKWIFNGFRAWSGLKLKLVAYITYSFIKILPHEEISTK